MAHTTQIKHSSHPHLLQLSASNQQPSVNLNCAGCNLHISPNDHVYTCRPCNFFLHMSCSKFPQLITHPSHREHALSLICTPIYPGGFFKCDACTQHGTRFSYHCHTCDFDLHVLCSSKPLSVNTQVHHHPLVLTFSSPYGEKEGFSCDVCKNAGLSGQWLYRCVSCGFDVHLDCATSKLQHNLSFPGAAPVAHPNQYVVAGQPLAHSLSTGHAPANWQPQQQQIYAPAGGFQGYQQPSQPQPQLQPYQMAPQQPQPVGMQNYQMQQQQQQRQQQLLLQQQQQQLQLQQQQLRQQQLQLQQQQQLQLQQQQQPGLADVMVTGFVDGMCQQLGQDFVQSLTGGGDGGGGGGDAGGGFSFECSAE